MHLDHILQGRQERACDCGPSGCATDASRPILTGMLTKPETINYIFSLQCELHRRRHNLMVSTQIYSYMITQITLGKLTSTVTMTFTELSRRWNK